MGGEKGCFTKINTQQGRGGGGYSQKNWVGVCGPLPKTPTLFMTKICDICDLTKKTPVGKSYEHREVFVFEKLRFSAKAQSRRFQIPQV